MDYHERKEKELFKYNSVKKLKSNIDKMEDENVKISKGLGKFYEKVYEGYKVDGRINKNVVIKLKTEKYGEEERIHEVLMDEWAEIFDNKARDSEGELVQDLVDTEIKKFLDNSLNYIKEGFNEIKKSGGFITDMTVQSTDVSKHFKPDGKPKKEKLFKKSKLEDITRLGSYKSPTNITFWYSFIDVIYGLEHDIIDDPIRYGVKYDKAPKIFESIISYIDQEIMKYEKEMIMYNKKAILEGIKELDK